MVLTVTLNPLLERRITFPRIMYGKENRGGDLVNRTGGKGINVSRQLNILSIENTALTFAGGNSGKLFKDILYKEKIKPVLIRTESETREALIFLDSSTGELTTCFENNQLITDKEAHDFWDKLEKMIPNYEMIVFSGSSPCKETEFIFPAGIELANKLDKVSICDTYGNHLQACMDASPVVVHNNVNEISPAGKRKTEKEIVDYLDYLYNKNIKQTYITDGGNSFYASNFNFHYRVEFSAIKETDSTGSGDAFIAGIVYGWEQDFVFEESVKYAVSLGMANAESYDVCRVTMEEIMRHTDEVKVTPVGKKMKQLDVTPQ